MRRAALLVVVAVAACNDDVDLTGIYKVDSNVASMPCGADAPIADPPVALKFAKANFFGAEYFSYQTCDDLAATMCSTGGLFDAGFSEPIDSGWRGIVTSSGGGGSLCTISYTEQTAILRGSQLVIESSRYSEQVDNTTTLCSPEEAERRNTSMPCASHERIEATKQ
jgi:hypothetical protein